MMWTRRELIRLGALSLLAPRCITARSDRGAWVNDVHSGLNPTWVSDIETPESADQVQDLVRHAASRGRPLAIAGRRHAMGGQQFRSDATLINIRGLNRVLELDSTNGIVDVESGVEWPELIEFLVEHQQGRDEQWGIAQKQTGADRLTMGGALAANIHGRGLRMKPFIADVESFVLITADGTAVRCSRTENRELFSLAFGGYGLFGVVTSMRLRLVPRQKLERVVEIQETDGLMDSFERRIADDYTYGDFQFSIDQSSENYLRRGIFSCYRPVPLETPIPETQRELGDDDWRALFLLAHADKAQAYERYASYYLGTSGQIYWSDLHQLSVYIDDYHRYVEVATKAREKASEIITEIYVPRTRLADFLEEVREDFLRNEVDLIYGTIRLIERDDESFLAWAREPFACTIFNLHAEHSSEGLRNVGDAFRRLIAMAIRRGGSYFLTYHREATREQVEMCYPRFAAFLEKKREHDPGEIFQSDWYAHYRRMFST
ncbi:MAG TPA: FAD-binding oxidoreductase [Thermoanaerobaculia bacterium]|nr:FAD-binding oxidoreductase [Thermoanaerobaculia bacterium]